jgi:hypothetical protein
MEQTRFFFVGFVTLILLSCWGTNNTPKSSDSLNNEKINKLTYGDTIKKQLKDSIMQKYYTNYDTNLWHVDYIDSLDLNYDKIKDLVVTIDYEGVSSVGYNIQWDIYFFDKYNLRYTADTLMRNLPNPDFDSIKRRLYTLHLGRNNVSSARVFIWDKNRWYAGNGFEICPSEDTSHFLTGLFFDGSGKIIKNAFFDNDVPLDSLIRELHKQ